MNFIAFRFFLVSFVKFKNIVIIDPTPSQSNEQGSTEYTEGKYKS
jgi:hypothetical protein